MNGLLGGLFAVVVGGPLLVVVSLAGVSTATSGHPPAAAASEVPAVPAALRATFALAALHYEVPAPILEAVAATESSFDPAAVGPPVPDGPALGMMQFLPSTYAEYSVVAHSTPFDARPAILAAARLLSADGHTSHGWDATQALFAYNHSTAYVARVLATARTYGYRADVA